MACRRFKYELKDARTGEYLADMSKTIYDSARRAYAEGDDIELPDFLIHRNNSQRLRRCFFEVIIPSGQNRFVAYIRPTEEEVHMPSIDFQYVNGAFVNGVDWSGADGWLNLLQDKKA